MRFRELREYEDLNVEKEKIISTISGLEATDEQQAKMLDRIWKLLNSETVGNNITNAFKNPMADELMPEKTKEAHRIELTKILSQLDSDYASMNQFLKKLESGGVINIEQLKKPVNSFSAVFDGDAVALKAFDALKQYGVGQAQKGPGEFALAMLSNKIRLAEGDGDTEIEGIGKVEVKAAVGSSGAGGRLGHGGTGQSQQMATLEKYEENIPVTLERIRASKGGSIGISEFVKSLNAELDPSDSTNRQLRQKIALELLKPNFGSYANSIAETFGQTDPNVVIAEYVKQNFEWYKNRDNFDAYLLISFTRKKTGMGRTGEDIIKLRETGQITGFGISMIPTKAGPREQFAQITMNAAGIG